MAKHNGASTQSDDRAQPEDAITLLQADHRRMRNLFHQYEATHDQHLKHRVAEQVFAALALHAQLEETVFYPAFRDAAEQEGDRLVGGALQEHQLFKDLIAELREIDAEDVEFEVLFHELMHYIEQHMEEEERDLFPQAKERLAAQMQDLRDAMQELKQQHVAS